jgi:hypothetical protein
MSYTDYEDINSLDGDVFIGGDTREYTFSVVDTVGAAVSLNGATITWKMCPYGYPTSSVVSKSLAGGGISIIGDVVDGVFQVDLDSADTEDLSGKFAHQASITDSVGKKFTPNQGIITITKEIE